MKGVSLRKSTNKRELVAIVDPLLVDAPFDVEAFSDFIKHSDFSNFHLSKNKTLSLAEAVNLSAEQGTMDAIEMSVAELKDGKFSITMAKDQMSVTLTISASETGDVANSSIIELNLQQQGIVRGISHKRIRKLINRTIEAPPGTELSDIIAKGLLPRDGKDSYLKPLVSNSFERVLAPQDAGHNKVDMRNLGDIICVKAGQSVAKHVPPGKGRSGFTVTNKPIKSTAGNWTEVKLGENTKLSPSDEKIVIATIDGQPKYDNGLLSIDNTYVASGVNVGTGNIKFEGAVIVNGDVTENMQIIAKGDITINGFVESAFIRAGGDIIITMGAMGKMQQEDCQLIASGNVYLQHGQGIDIVAGKNINIAKQLAYSRVKCRGDITVGSPDMPLGNLFASNIKCHKTVKAGSIGAVSGSELIIDFSEGYNLLCSRSDSLSELLKTLTISNADHEIKVSALNHKIIPEALKEKMRLLNDELESERILLTWIQGALDEILEKRNNYETNARVIANKEIFPGVSICLNNKVWKAEKEHAKCRIILENSTWVYDPLC